MTTAIVSTTEYTRAQIAHRKACAFLKGTLCGYAERKGHKYTSTKEWPEDFKAGFETIQKERWVSAESITQTHVLHNRLRHHRPHISKETDARWICGWAKSLLREHLGNDLAEELEAFNE